MGLGCNVSSITFLTALVAVLSTFVAVGLVYGSVWSGKRVVSWWREREGRSRSNGVWRGRLVGILGMEGRRGRRLGSSGDEGFNEDREDEERRPLLG